ncbi:MAG: fibronectin type III domain-containing protein [Verrucomicrobia bacterium]|nr:fibronectin type III domain-containing protein [Verrucomicrobiota bacterium]
MDLAINAVVQKRDAHALAIADLVEARTEVKNKVEANMDILSGSRDLLKRSLGKQYSTAWAGTGFNFSLSMPRSVASMVNVTGTLKGYLTSHPDMERAELMTAAILGASLDALSDAQDAVTLKKSALGTQLTARLQEEKNLRILLSWTVDELGRKLDPLDDRWTAFGFNKPGLKATPPVPQNLLAVLIGTNAISMKWDKAARATHYRIWKKVIGVDADFVFVDSRGDLDFTIEGLPGNSQVEVLVSAVNSGGESQRTTAVLVQTL